MVCEANQNGDEIFIIDKDAINDFFKDSNFENSQMFFDYLTIHCKIKRAYMLPSIFNKIKQEIKEKAKSKSNTTITEVLSYFDNWVKEATFLGEEQGDEVDDTLLLYAILKYLNPDKKIIILSNNVKYQDQPINTLSLQEIQSYLLSKEEFKKYLKEHYGFLDGALY